jgi:hypothetical protein
MKGKALGGVDEARYKATVIGLSSNLLNSRVVGPMPPCVCGPGPISDGFGVRIVVHSIRWRELSCKCARWRARRAHNGVRSLKESRTGHGTGSAQ